MAELHTLIVIDSETGKVRLASLDEAPVDSSEWVFDDPDWRRPTDREVDIVMEVEHDIVEALRPTGMLA